MKILHKISKLRTYIILFMIAVIFTGISVFSYTINYSQIAEGLNSCDENIFVTCTVSSYPKVKIDTTSFVAKITGCDREFLQGESIYVTIGRKETDFTAEYGALISFTAPVEIPDNAANPGGFDFRSYLRGIGCVGSAFVDGADVTLMKAPSGIGYGIYRIRQRFTENCDKYFSPENSAMIKAIVSGDRTEMDSVTSDALKIAGVYHIVAISGLHLNLFTCAVAYIVSRFVRGRRKKAIITLVSCLGTSIFVLLFTGFGISVWRALIMMVILCGSAVVARDYSAKNALMICAFVILCTMPCSLWSVSFQLSFLSTFAVLVSIDIQKHFLKEKETEKIFRCKITNSFTISVMSILFTLPVTVTSFGYIPVYSPVANLFILIFMPYLLGSGAVFAVTSCLGLDFAAKLVSYPATSFSALIRVSAGIISSLPGAALNVNVESLIFWTCIFLSAIAISYVVLRHGVRKSVITILIFVVAWGAILGYNNKNGQLTVTYADVGQGESALISLGDKCVMIDCGTGKDTEFTASEIEALLRTTGKKHIDALIVSHFHRDHTNVIPELLERGLVARLVLPEYYDFIESEARNNRRSILEESLRSKVPVSYVSKGSEVTLGNDAKIDFLSPSADMFEENNDMSLVAKLSYGECDFLFCGDIQNRGMDSAVDEITACEVVKVAHHGGYCDNSDDFLKKVSPKYSIISCGENNIYGHPRKETLDILKSADSKIYRTDTDGAITIVADKQKILKITTMR